MVIENIRSYKGNKQCQSFDRGFCKYTCKYIMVKEKIQNNLKNRMKIISFIIKIIGLVGIVAMK